MGRVWAVLFLAPRGGLENIMSDIPGHWRGYVPTSGTGRTISIGGTDFRLDGDGNTIYGLAAAQPSASDAASAVGVGAIYYSVDTQAIEMTDGTTWQTV